MGIKGIEHLSGSEDPILAEFRTLDLTGKLIGLHLQMCSSLRRCPGTERGLECDHNYWWNLNVAEQANRMRKL